MAEKSSRSASSTSTTTANVGKLYRLLFDGGTKAVKIQLEKYFTPFPSKLVNFLKTNLGRIQELVESKVLNSDQLKQLRPHDGSDPDPENFDISLIILILTNFCPSVLRPWTGWYNMPQEKDKSLSAKLVRLRLFRNKLLHRPNTRFEEKEFLDLWKKLEGILCSLGLPSSDIEKFRRLEDCEEEYYFEILKKWADSEEDSNRRFKAIYENQVKAQQTLQDTNQRVLIVEQNQMEASKLQQVDHKTLKDTHQVAQDTNQRVLLVEQNQMEATKLQQVDHKTLADTHQVAEGLQRSVEQVLRTQQETQQQIKDVAADAKERSDKGREDEALRKLAKVNTERVIQYHSGKYQEGTRLRIIERINLWLDDRTSENRVMVISGDAGMGKSVISAVVCQRMRHAGRLSGSHFCQHNKARPRNPKIMLQSLAYQLSEFLPPYKRELVKALSRNLGEDINKLEVGELFELLFEEPLRNVDDPGECFLMVIDGLDESEYKGRNEMLDVIGNHFSALPVWFRFCVTTRPEIMIAKRLQKLNPLHLQQNNEENVKDIRIFFETQLGNVIQSGCEEVVIDALVREAAGHFLYAYLMVDFIKENVSLLTPEELGKTLPSGVTSVYQSYFERLEKELTISEELFLTFLSALAAAKEPLPLDFVSKMLLSDIKSPAGYRKVRKAIECISTLLPVQDGCIHFFHKSVKDWLTDGAPDIYGVQHKFYVNEDQGHRALSQLCVDELDDVKRKSVHGTDFNDAAKYALQYGVGHMLELEESARASGWFEEIINNYVTDLDIVHAKLCVHNTVNSEDIIRVQEREAFKSLSDESQRALSMLFSLVIKYHRRLSTHPSTIFQVMVNEGGDVFAGEATKVLQSREIPYMEYFHREALKELNKTQAEFPCKSAVACFDISPKQEFMVCECTDGMIYLWSLKTFKQMWERRVEVKKCYFRPDLPFRVVPNSNVYSCYRSVVFHPTEPFVLPGILSHAYSFEGDVKSLCPGSNCKFSVCSVHGDESKIITDCPGDAKCLVMWNLKNGEEITRTIRNEDVLSFAWSPDGTLLAISHFSGLVCLVDALNCLETTLAEVTTDQPCGMIKFTRDIQFLFCWSWPLQEISLSTLKSFRVKVIKLPCSTFSLNVLEDYFVHDRDYESSSKGGFLMGDPIFFGFTHSSRLPRRGFTFVLNKQSVLRVLCQTKNIKMLNCDTEEYTMANWRSPVGRFSCLVAFALDGKTIYRTTAGDKEAHVVSLDVSSGDRKAEKVISTRDVLLVPVSEGVLLKQRKPGADVQLWNFELSQQIRSWPNLSQVSDIMPFSDQCVACVGRDFEVSILDTSNGNIVKTIPLYHEGYKSTYDWLHKEAIVCNRKYQLLSTSRKSVQLSDGKKKLWKRTPKFGQFLGSWSLPGMFSPTEDFVLISLSKSQFKNDVCVLQASSGDVLRTLCTVYGIIACAFVSETECVIVCLDSSRSYCLQLFNVSTGDFLTVLDIDFKPSCCLASCPQKGLIAIGLENSKCMCAVIQVKQLRDKVNREAKVSESWTLGDKGFPRLCPSGNKFLEL